MRRAIFIIISWPLLLGFGLSPASALNVAGLQKLQAQGASITVIDVRSPSAFAAEHIPGAINLPAPVVSLKQLPPLGRVVVYGDGLIKDDDTTAAASLAAKPGIQVEILTGGYAAWKSAQGLTTRGSGLKRESFNYITYAQLKASKKNLVLFDLRHPRATGAPALTDLSTEFPALKQVQSHVEALQGVSVTPSLVVLIDDGNGDSEKEARLLKMSGTHNYVILAGGEMILSRHGQAGLQRSASANPVMTTLAPGGKK
jgi:rhodanese-related sulfurtransferase